MVITLAGHSHYVMCAFVCREVIARHGERAALALVECGAEGERFFGELERLLGVTGGNVAEAARRAGISRPGLHAKLQALAIDPDQ